MPAPAAALALGLLVANLIGCNETTPTGSDSRHSAEASLAADEGSPTTAVAAA